jgi:hypothetical protein
VEVVSVKVRNDTGSKFLFGDLTVTVSIDFSEDRVRLGSGDTLLTSFGGGCHLDGRGGGDESEGEFHFEGCFVLFVIII